MALVIGSGFFVFFFGERLAETGCFVGGNHMHLIRNHPSKYLLIGVNRFLGVRVHKTHTHRYTY